MTFGWLHGPGAIAQHWHANCGVLLVTLIALAAAAPASGEDTEVAYRRSIERRTFSDAEIIDGFFKVTFGAEFHVAGGVDRIRKYEGPVLVYVDNRAQPNRSTQVTAVVADIRSRIRDLDIATTAKGCLRRCAWRQAPSGPSSLSSVPVKRGPGRRD